MFKSVRTIALVALGLSAARQSAAQSARPPELFQGLFGPTEAEQTRPRRLDVSWSLYDAVDDNSFLATDTDILDATLQDRRWYHGASIGMQYARRPPGSVLTLSASSSARYYPDLRQIVTQRYSGGMTFDVYPARDWRVQFANNVSYSPYYQVVLTPSAALLSESQSTASSPSASPAPWAPDSASPNSDNSVAKQHLMQYRTFAGATHTFNARASIAFNYGLQYTQFFGSPDSRSERAAVQFTQSLTKDVGLRLGYAYGLATTGSDPAATPIRNDDLDIGLVYGRSFSLSSRTSFGFSTGSTIISSSEGRHFAVTGAGRLSRKLSAKWTARVLYDRGLQVPEGATRPFFSDSLGANVSGHFNRRISLRVQPSYSHGVVGFSGLTNSYNNVTSTTRLDVALAHRLAFYVEHFYYQYQFANRVGLPPMLTTGMDRRGVRIGLSLWTPFVQ